MPKKLRIGDFLVQNNLINEEQLQNAIIEQKKKGSKLGKILISNGLIEEEKFMAFLAKNLDIPYIDILHYDIDTQLIAKLPEKHARRFRAILLDEKEGVFTIAMAEPHDISALDSLSRIVKKSLKPVLVRESDLLIVIDANYRHTEEISGFAEELSAQIETASSDFDVSSFGVTSVAEEAPVVKMLESLFADAVQAKASDIHIEPDENVLRIRERIDGVLQEQIMNKKAISGAITQRLKLVAGLNIAEKRLPQDGRFNIKVLGKSIDVRISTLPTQYGESIVMRLLDQSGTAVELGQLGMPNVILERMKWLIRQPHGMILVTGPTGSGKTTTLYSILDKLNQPEKKIITVEDPVEYRIGRINQVQVQSKIDLTFSKVLRSILRQDPDIIMVGEIRDEETASIALRAAMTGHLVLATLHTNDVISSALRLVDMGAEGYLVGSAVRGVLAQRLVRCICVSCSIDSEPNPQQHSWLQNMSGGKYINEVYKKGKGCTRCGNTGYSGRVGAFELLEIDELMMDAMRRNNHSDFAHAAQHRKNRFTLTDSAMDLAIKGVTTLDEVFRVVGDVEDMPEMVA